MATMATSHSLAVLTNACVKTPLNPETGLAASLHDRPATFHGRLSTAYYDDYDHEHLDDRDILEFSTSPPTAIADPHAVLQLSNLSDEEFYQKLLHLKQEQRKILEKCERLYIEKHQGDEGVQSYSARYGSSLNGDYVPKDSRKIDSEFVEARPQSPVLRDGGITPPFSGTPPRDNVRDLHSKPPTGRPPVPLVAKSLTIPPARPSSAPLERSRAWSTEDLRHTALGLHQSLEDEYDNGYVPDDTVSEPYRPRDISFALSQIDDMWDNFSVDEYAPRRSQGRLSSDSGKRKEEKTKKDSWRHRLTVPKPFSMTIRESNKEKKKSLTLQEFEKMKLEREQQEAEECMKKFKATPVPAHVYLPLYDEVSEKSEQRRRYIKECSEELLKSTQKPFSFTKREEDKKMHARLERECSQDQFEKRKEKKTEGFKAKPVPKYIFDHSVNDKIMEEEEYRKIRIKMRSRELLRSASLPPNMEAREKAAEQKKREMSAKTKKRRHHQRPKVNHEVPNYDALYRQFQQELQQRKAAKEATVSQPFRLETQRITSKKEKIKQDIERDEETLHESRWPYKNPRAKIHNLGHISVSLDSLPAKSTRSHDVRSSKVKNHISQLSYKEQREIEEEKRRRVREMKLRRYIQERTPKDTPVDSYEEKTKRIRAEDRARRDEYQRELQEMKDRVNKRPLLFEQESQTNAKKAAEKKFNATLKSVGLDEDFINSRGSRSTSFQDNTDDYDDDFEDTYVKRHDDRSGSPIEA